MKMKYKIYVDGQEGTTGLKINERLSGRTDIEILKIASEKRKDIEARRALLNEADIVFLCLPDDASREAVSLVENKKTRIIDASTAFRTHEDWTYGLPELSKEQRELIHKSSRVANPGCHATGFNLAVYPLIKAGIIPKTYPITAYSVTGYSGAGKKMIALYEESDEDTKKKLESPRFYSLNLTHKHLPEMKKVCELNNDPLFTPIIGDFYKGMLVSIPLIAPMLNKKVTAKDVQEIMANHYASEHFVKVIPFDSAANLDNGFLNATECNDTNKAEIFVFGRDEQILVISRFDNLGKGASGAAVQNMNIMLGIDEKVGLE